MSTKICLVRHGETDWNVQGRLQGSIDIPLNAHGLRQAHAAAKALSTEHFHVIYSSDLQRAAMTAHILGAARGMSVVFEPKLRERQMGAFEGLTREEAERRFPEAYAGMAQRRPNYEPPGGELVEAFAQRIAEALAQLAAQHPAQSVLAIAHGGVLDMAYRLATQTPLDQARAWTLNNTSLNWLEYEHGQWHVLAWGDTTHLAAARDEAAA